MGKLKIGVGFHCGEPSLTDGLGEYYNTLAANGHALAAKATDGTAGLYDVQALGGIGIWRKTTFVYTVRIGEEVKYYTIWDVPHYNDDPMRQAQFFMQQYFDEWPTGLNKRTNYIETPNEADKNEANFLGEYMVACATLALANGHKYCGPAFAGGEPEPEHWEAPGMLAYLRMCEQHPDDLAVSLHEYTLQGLDVSLADTRTFSHGRVTWLNEVCVKHGIKPPAVFLTE